jgi:hypothetical protein
MKLANPHTLGFALVIAGLIIVLLGAYLAYDAYQIYRPVLPKASTLDQAITNTTYELVNLVLKLGFLGILVWSGGMILNHGISSVIEAYRIDKGVSRCTQQQNSGSQQS